MNLSQAFLEQLGIRNGNRDLLNHPGDTCSQGHPFGDAEDCANCPTERDLVEDAADYRTLAGHVIGLLNPPAGKTEVETCMEAISTAVNYLSVAVPCTCGREAEAAGFPIGPCGRCVALGRRADKKVQW